MWEVLMTTICRHHPLEKFNVLLILAKMAYFKSKFSQKEWNLILSTFNELSEKYSEFWIISLHDQDITDLVRGPKIGIIKIYDKIGKFEMSRTTTYLGMRRPKKWCTKVNRTICPQRTLCRHWILGDMSANCPFLDYMPTRKCARLCCI